MRTAEKKAKPRQTGKAVKMSKLEMALGYQLPSGVYVPDWAIDEWMGQLNGKTPGIHNEPPKEETDAEIDARLKTRFEAMDQLTQLCIGGDIRSLVVSGPPGLGKSYNIEQALKQYDPKGRKYTIIKGFATGTGFFKQLWDHRHDGSILVMDDSDSIWNDEKALGLLKSATDTTEERVIHYLSEGTLQSDKDKSIVPNRFTFDGTIIFITNQDLDAFASSNHRFAPHMEALMSRGQYVDLTMRNRRDYLVRIRQVYKQGLLNFMPAPDAAEVMKYIEENHKTLRELSIRIALKIAALKTKAPKNWKELAKVTCYRAI